MMDQKKNLKTNNSVDFNNLNEKHLSIQLSLDGFSFCIINKVKNQVEKLEHFVFEDKSPTPEKLLKNVEELFKKEKHLQKRYGSVNISHVNQLSTLVPKSLFDEDRIRDYLKFSSKTYTNDYLVHDELENHDMVNVYVPFVNVNNFFLQRYGSFEYKHFSTVFVNTLLNTFKFSEHPHMFVHIGENQLEIMVIAHDKLIFYNSFTYETKEDFIYYILFTAEQMELNPEVFELVIAGKINLESDFYTIAYTYVRKVSLLENRSQFKFPSNIKEETKRQYFTLLNQYS